MTIGIDVDGVLRNFCDALTRVIREYYPQYLPDDFVEIKHWNFLNDFSCTRDDIKQIYRYDHVEEIMGNANPIYGAIEQMYDLVDWADKNKHSLVCVTSQKPDIRHHTLSWLGKYGLNFDTIYFIKGRFKWKIPVDYLIDDSPENFGNWVRGRGTDSGYILMDRPYNKNIKTKNRIYQIGDIVKHLNEK